MSFEQPVTGVIGNASTTAKDSKLNQIIKLIATIKENEISQASKTFEIRDNLLDSVPKEEAGSADKTPVQGILEKITEDLNIVLCFQERTRLNISDIFIATK